MRLQIKLRALTKFVTLQTQQPNTVDCAVAKATIQNLVSKDILYIGAPQGTAPAAIDMTVHKFGRTTGYTVGQVTSVDTDVTVQYDIGNITFTGQIIIVGSGAQPFSNAGDSEFVLFSSAELIRLSPCSLPDHLTIRSQITSTMF